MARLQLIVVLLCFAGPFAPTGWGQDLIKGSSATAEEELSARETTHVGVPFELGVTVTDSPGIGVLVTGVLWGGPADRAGIRSGDFLMSVAGKPVTTPADLRNAMESAAADTRLTVGIWRNGDDISKTVSLASKFTDSSRQQAWLGVMLRMNDGKVLIADVVPASPASKGGLQVGDTVLRVDAENIDSAEELVRLMKRIKAGENIEVTVLRNGQERTFTVRVGSAVQQTMRWFEEHFPGDELQRPWPEFRLPGVDSEAYQESIEGMMDRLRQEMRDLRDEVNRLRGHKAIESSESTQDSNALDDAAAESSNHNDESVSNLESPIVPVALRRNAPSRNRARSYSNYRGGRPQVQYRYDYRRQYVRGANRSPRYLYYGAPQYYYPNLVYPRTPYIMRYGPRYSIYVGPGVYVGPSVYVPPGVFWY